MKCFSFSLLFFVSVVSAEWIEPPARSAKGYLVPVPDYNPLFPKDHGAHREYGLEWWYWVGHLETEESGHEYGFQSTVFRVAGDPQKMNDSDDRAFGNRHLFLAHSALSDLTNQKYLHNERVVREGWQARAGVGTLDLKVAGIEASMLENEIGHKVTTLYTWRKAGAPTYSRKTIGSFWGARAKPKGRWSRFRKLVLVLYPP